MHRLVTWAVAGLGSLAVLWMSVWEWAEVGQAGFAMIAGLTALLVGAIAAALTYARTHSSRWWPVVHLGIGLLAAVLIGEYFRFPAVQTRIYQGHAQMVEACVEDHHGTLLCRVTPGRP